MKGKKCIKLQILCITFLLSLNLFSNANAIEKKTSSINKNTASLEWLYRDGTGAGNITQSGNFISNVLGPIRLTANANRTTSLNNMKLNLTSNINLSKNRYFNFKIYFRVQPSLPTDSFSVPFCPRGKMPLLVDKCEITHIVDQNEISKIGELRRDPEDNLEYMKVYSDTNFFYVMEITGHYNSTDNTSLTGLEFENLFYAFYNNSIVPQAIEVFLYFSPVEEYTLEESATEKEQAQELEDRDNLESQSTTTDNEADNAGNAAETTGTTLFGAFSQLFTALTNVNGNSCTLPNMQVYSLNLGRMNLCTYDIPPQIMALVSIGMVFIIVPLGIHLVKRMINLYKEITG